MQTFAQHQSPAQKKDASSASSVLDASSQSKSLQRKADLANNAAQRAEAPRPNNTGMPDNLKSGIESLSGFSMDDVRVHYNSSKPATVQALAYTQGTDIHVAPGQEKHLPHEAWHVAQQMAGRVSPTTNINGMPVNNNAGLEHEADVMGEKAVTQRKEIKSDSTTQNLKTNAETIQRVWIGIDTTMNHASYMELYKARKKIWDEFYVQAIFEAPYLGRDGIPNALASNNDYVMKAGDQVADNWGDILIQKGETTGFCRGKKAKGNQICLDMNIDKCQNMFFGTPEEYDTTKKGNQTIEATLLHELGHAYQHFLNIRNKDKQPNPTYNQYNIYPMFYDALINMYNNENPTIRENAKERLNNALEKYGNTNSFEGILDKDTNALLEAAEILNNIGKTADFPNDDADNLFMNEIPYNSSKPYLGVRKHYVDSFNTNEDENEWKFRVFKTKNNVTPTDVDKIKDFLSNIGDTTNIEKYHGDFIVNYIGECKKLCLTKIKEEYKECFDNEAPIEAELKKKKREIDTFINNFKTEYDGFFKNSRITFTIYTDNFWKIYLKIPKESK